MSDETKGHTPGPWRVAESNKTVGILVWRGAPETGNRDYVRVARNVATKADANLIAAAPEMLAVLIEVREGMRDPRQTMSEEFHDRVCAAIANAEGKP